MKREEPRNKTAALNSNLPVVRSAKVPAVRTEELRDFDDFARMGDKLLRIFAEWGDAYDAISEAKPSSEALEVAKYRASLIASSLPRLQHDIEKFNADWFYFERDELYRKEAKLAPDLLDNETQFEVTREFVGRKLAEMVATITQKPAEPKVYSRMMIEEVIAARPRACALEATSREIRRTPNEFFPSTGKVLKVLREQMEHWERLVEIDDCLLTYYRKRFDELVTSLTANLAKQEQQERERKARLEKQAQERQTRLAKEKQEREERMAKEREAREQATREYFNRAGQIIALADDPMSARTWFNSDPERRKRKEIGIPVDDVVAFLKTIPKEPTT